MPGLAIRALSAAVLLPLVVAALYFGGTGLALLVILAALLMGIEWERLVAAELVRPAPLVHGVVLAAIVLLAALVEPRWGLVALAVAALLAAGLDTAAGRRPCWRPLGLLWLGLPCLALLWLRDQPGFGFTGTLWLLAVVWACDTGAYFAGRSIGGPRLAPRMSPNKTWAGLAGGMLAAAAVGPLMAAATGAPGAWGLALAGALLAVVAQLGDLAESAVKRHFGVKDSGALIPGHGGILDRVDGLLFALPAAAVVELMTHGVLGRW